MEWFDLNISSLIVNDQLMKHLKIIGDEILVSNLSNQSNISLLRGYTYPQMTSLE